jgi:DNA-directed RNA polymerase specialized sigma subunit
MVTDQEIAESLGMTYEEYMEIMNDSADWEWH